MRIVNSIRTEYRPKLSCMDLYEALYTTRAMRRVSPDPIEQETVDLMLDAATRAPSGGNNQNWRMITITDQELRDKLGSLYRQAWDILLKTVYKDADRSESPNGSQTQTFNILKSSTWLADNFETVPLWVFFFHRNDPTGASIYPAVWNLMLAARGQEIGTCLTTILGVFKSDEVFDLLGVPKDKGWTLGASVSCGHPLGRWGTAARKAAQDVTYAETWGTPLGREIDGPMWSHQ